MTSEVILMNKNGLAIAADSAVTRSDSNRPPHYQRKLFSMTQPHNIAIMLHDRMQINSVPVETILNIYQSHKRKNALLFFDDYVTDFISYLGNNKNILGHQDMDKDMNWTCDALHFLMRLGQEIYQNWQDPKHNINNESIQKFMGHYLDQKIEKLNATADCNSFKDKETRQNLKKDIENLDSHYIDQILNLFPLSHKMHAKIYRLLYLMTIKNNFDMGHTVIVIAGFGSEDIFPKVPR